MFNLIRKQPRLVQWNGRRQPAGTPRSRAQVLVPPILVLATVLAVTMLAVWWGPPMPYRLGEVCRHDLRVRVDFELVNHIEFVNQQDRSESSSVQPLREQAQFTDRPVVKSYPRGMLLGQRDHADRRMAARAAQARTPGLPQDLAVRDPLGPCRRRSS